MRVKILHIDESIIIDPFDNENINANDYIGKEGEANHNHDDLWEVKFSDGVKGSFIASEFRKVG